MSVNKINTRSLDFDAYAENECINGSFDIWQRGASQTSAGYGSDDRWSNNHLGSTKTHSRELFGFGQMDVSGNPKYYSRTVVSSVTGSSNFVTKSHSLLDVRRQSNTMICVSFYAKANTTCDISLEGVQNFGTGGSTTVDGIDPQKISLLTTWEKYTVFMDMPSVSGKTIVDLSFTKVIFWFDAGSDYDSRTVSLGQQSVTIDISSVEIYNSNITLPVRRPSYNEVLERCHPYCTVLAATKWNWLAQLTAIDTTKADAIIPTPARLIRIPTITLSGTAILKPGGLSPGSPYATAVITTGLVVRFTTTGLLGGSSYIYGGNGTTDISILLESEL